MLFRQIKQLLLLFCISVFLFIPIEANSQIIRATGNAIEASSQIVYFYDLNDIETAIHITNTNDTEGVWIHVQLFRSYDPDNDGTTSNSVFCEERNFVDFLTPNDTHIYEIGDDNFVKNIGETAADSGDETTIVDTDGTKGFIIITPVVSEADLSAKSFQYLFGSSHGPERQFSLNAMGRDAVDLSTGEVLADDTVLDGVAGGFVLLQPEELLFDFESDSDIDITGIVFSDVYGPPGLLGYAVQPADALWTSFVFDFKEDPTSCGMRMVDCFLTVGLNDDILQNNDEFRQGISGGDDLLCAGTSSLDYPDDNDAVVCPNCGDNIDFTGWVRIFISGLSDLENHLGVIYDEEFEDARWMFTNK